MRVTSEKVVASLSADLAALGIVTPPNVRGLRRHYSRLLAVERPSLIRDIAGRLHACELPYGRVLAYELITNHKQTFESLSLRQVVSFGQGMASWSDVDCFACYLAGLAWRHGLIPTTAVKSWARSSNRWWRRAALVATVPLNVKAQGGTGDSARTLAVCKLLIADRDPMVVKALSWALRALAVREPREVSRFLRTHEGFAPLVVREVETKLKTGRKRGKPLPR
jgi:3-methyladenine DNA glycosylase AlkD